MRVLWVISSEKSLTAVSVIARLCALILLGHQSSALNSLPKTLKECKPIQAAEISAKDHCGCPSSTDLELHCAAENI